MNPDYSYQEDAISETLRKLESSKRVILQGPTGCGKTQMAVELARKMPKPLMFLAESKVIVYQSEKVFRNAGMSVTTLDADTITYRHFNSMLAICNDVTVASQKTAWSRAVRKQHKIGDFKSIIVDECHHALAKTYLDLLDCFPDAKVVGLTATPMRSDGRGLGRIFDELVQGEQYGGNYTSLISRRVLVPCPPKKIWSWSIDQLEKVRVQAGDYVMGGKSGADRLMNDTKLIGDIVKHWDMLAENRPTIMFATSVSHAENTAIQFRESGIQAEFIHAGTPQDERDRIIALLGNGGLNVVTNFGVFTEGFDCPPVSCLIMARPTKQLGLYLQMVGRGLRASPETGKEDLLIIDSAGMVQMHGIPGSDILWTLDAGKKSARLKPKEKRTPKPRFCPECGGSMFGKQCESCGYEIRTDFMTQLNDRFRHNLEENLVNLEDGGLIPGRGSEDRKKRSRYIQFIRTAEKYNLKFGWAAHRFKDEYGEFPPLAFSLPDPQSCEPSQYFKGCRAYASMQGWKAGWAAHRFKEVYGEFPPKDGFPEMDQQC